ncbi:MAG TPA: hypothetical protein V6D47_20455 [Oscillatoriaceae cyanobacterium]
MTRMLSEHPPAVPSRRKTLQGKLLRWITNAFLVAYLGSVTLWLCPGQNLLVSRLQNAISPVVDALGLWQEWAMFAPEPVWKQYRLMAAVRFSDGSVRRWHFTDSDRLEGWDRVRYDRQAAWVENVADYGTSAYGDACVYAARQLYRANGPRPLEVTLMRACLYTPPPEVGLYGISLDKPAFVKIYHRAICSLDLAP